MKGGKEKTNLIQHLFFSFLFILINYIYMNKKIYKEFHLKINKSIPNDLEADLQTIYAYNENYSSSSS